MNLERIWALTFSPTGNSERVGVTVARTLAECLRVPAEAVSLNRPDARQRQYAFGPADFLVLACPTYAGKLPNKILPDLKACLRGDHTPACALVTFGNRAFDNSLAELLGVLTAGGFETVSAAAVVAEHAFTPKLGGARPGVTDIWALQDFARKTAGILRGLPDSADAVRGTVGDADAVRGVPERRFTPVNVPGDPAAPYYVPKGTDGLPARFLKAKPKVNARCNQCGACARNCPTGAINPRDVSDVPGVCIKCQACVRGCTRQARFFDDPAFLSHVAMLERTFPAPKENAFFYGNPSAQERNPLS